MNKNLFLTGIVVAVTVLSLAGCQSNPADQKANAGKDDSQNGIVLTPPSEEVQKLLSLQDQLSQIVKTGDVSKCTDLSMEQYAKSCEVNILANKATTATDTAVCDTASSEDLKTQCLTLVAAKK